MKQNVSQLDIQCIPLNSNTDNWNFRIVSNVLKCPTYNFSLRNLLVYSNFGYLELSGFPLVVEVNGMYYNFLDGRKLADVLSLH